MAIIFKKIRWKNLLSTGNIFTELDLNSDKNTLIIGENGAGKSTFLDAICFVLFNKPFRNINKPQLINSIIQKNMLVEIEFSIGKTNYKVIRGMKPNIFELYKNEKLIDQSAETKDYQEFLETQILKMNHKSFCQVVVLGSASYTPFMQLPSGQRREIVEDLLNLQIFSAMNDILKEKNILNETTINQLSNSKILVEEKIRLIQHHINEMKKNNSDLIAEKNNKIEENTNKAVDLISQIDEIKEKIETEKKNIIDISEIEREILEINKKITIAETTIDNLKKDIRFFEKHDDCPTCKREIDSDFKCESINDRNNEISSKESDIKKLKILYDEKNSLVQVNKSLEKSIRALEMQEHKLSSSLEFIATQTKDLMKEIKKLKQTNTNFDTSEINDLKVELKTINSSSEEALLNKKIYQTGLTLLKDGGIKSKIIKQYIPIFNKLINKYLSSMEFMCHFELDETFKETIKSRYRDEFSYASFSEGEKFRINLAVLFTWRAVAKMRNSINTNLLIMDEVMDSSLDSTGTEEFLKIINSLTNETKVFIISHKTTQILDNFSKVIKFQKKHNFSEAVIL